MRKTFTAWYNSACLCIQFNYGKVKGIVPYFWSRVVWGTFTYSAYHLLQMAIDVVTLRRRGDTSVGIQNVRRRCSGHSNIQEKLKKSAKINGCLAANSSDEKILNLAYSLIATHFPKAATSGNSTSYHNRLPWFLSLRTVREISSPKSSLNLDETVAGKVATE